MGRPEIVVTSAGDFQERRKAAEEVGASHFFRKPEDFSNFIAWGKLHEGKTIVLVDDDEATCDAMKDALELSGVIVHAFSDPLEAIEKIPELEPDTIITDVEMPGMTGFELIEALREIYPEEE